MAESVTAKILKQHLLAGELFPGREIALQIDQTLTQDTTGTMVYLEFEALGFPRVKQNGLSPILIIIHYRQIFVMLMIIALFNRLQRNMGFIFREQVMGFIIKFI